MDHSPNPTNPRAGEDREGATATAGWVWLGLTAWYGVAIVAGCGYGLLAADDGRGFIVIFSLLMGATIAAVARSIWRALHPVPLAGFRVSAEPDLVRRGDAVDGKRVLVRSITSRRRKAAVALPVGYGPIDVDVDGVAWRAGWPAARLRSRRDRGRGQAPGRLGRHPPARRLIRTAAASRPQPPGALPVTGGAGGPAAQSARR